MKKFLALYDIHFGYERRGGHRVALHDSKAISAVMKFAKDFKPDHVILGGDILDCGAISHHNHGKPGAVEGLRLVADAKEVNKLLIKPIEEIAKGKLVYITGNHEGWLDQLVELHPGLEGIVDLKSILGLSKRWDVVEEGGAYKLGKLVFIHGDQIRGGEMPAKNAVLAYERNVRLGHFHTFQAFTKTSAVDANGHTGVVIPCLCKKAPKYGGGAPNKWMQGFSYGFVDDNGFNDFFPIIVNGSFRAEGKLYEG